MDIKGTKSEQNVMAAFAGESQARNKYTYFAAEARKEGHEDIAELFERMADNETEHAKIWFKLLNGGLGNVNDNLQAAASGENYEWKSMYPGFAADARAEGNEILAMMFEKVASIESDHERRFLEAFLAYKENLSADVVPMHPKSDAPRYRCAFCGATSDSPLDVCPLCEAIGAFELA